MFLCVPVFVLDGTLRNIFGSLRNVFGHLQILSDPTKNLGTLKIKNVTPINVKKSRQVYAYSNPGTQVGSQNNDFSAVSQTDLTRSLVLSVARLPTQQTPIKTSLIS